MWHPFSCRLGIEKNCEENIFPITSFRGGQNPIISWPSPPPSSGIWREALLGKGDIQRYFHLFVIACLSNRIYKLVSEMKDSPIGKDFYRWEATLIETLWVVTSDLNWPLVLKFLKLIIAQTSAVPFYICCVRKKLLT